MVDDVIGIFLRQFSVLCLPSSTRSEIGDASQSAKFGDWQRPFGVKSMRSPLMATSVRDKATSVRFEIAIRWKKQIINRSILGEYRTFFLP